MKVNELFEGRAKDLSWLQKDKRSTIIAASEKIKKMIDATGWLRVGFEDSEHGSFDYGHYIRPTDSSSGRSWALGVLGKYVPPPSELNISDLYIGDRDVESELRKKEDVTPLNQADIEKINMKSLRIMQGFIGTLLKTNLGQIKLDRVSFWPSNHSSREVVSPLEASRNLTKLINADQAYAPNVTLYFEFVDD
jgi:hypothetical protein